MDKKVVVTGYGLIEAKSFIDKDKKNNLFQLCKEIDSNQLINGRLKRKIDNFCIRGLIAVDAALKMSKLDIKLFNPYEIGISVGNSLGGWKYIEEEVIQLHKNGIKEVSPYLATAWFPAALQGQISIMYGIKGFSKTYSMIDLAGMQAIGNAVETIKNGKCKVMIAGASEDFSSKFVQNTLAQSYRKLISNNSTDFFTDAALFFILEDYEVALKRGAKIYCEIEEFLEYGDKATKKINELYLKYLDNKSQMIYYKDCLYENENNILENILSLNKVKVSTIKNISKNQFSVSGIINILHAVKKMKENNKIKKAIIQKLSYMKQNNVMIINNI